MNIDYNFLNSLRFLILSPIGVLTFWSIYIIKYMYDSELKESTKAQVIFLVFNFVLTIGSAAYMITPLVRSF